MVDAYLRYNQEVIDYFRGRDDCWEPLCGLLDLPVPRRDFPHVNPQTYDRRDAATQAPRERPRKRGFVQLEGIHAPLATGRCVGCGAPSLVGRRSTRSLIGRLPHCVKEPYRRLQRQAFVPARDDRDAEARAAALRDAHPGLTIDDLAAVTCFFNPCGYRSRLYNYHRFREAFAESGLPLVTVEPFHSPPVVPRRRHRVRMPGGLLHREHVDARLEQSGQGHIPLRKSCGVMPLNPAFRCRFWRT